MKNRILLVAALLVAGIAQSLACTNLIVGKKASKDGSVIVSYSADSYGMFGELYHFPAAKHAKDAMRKIYEWDSGKFLGEIKEAPETYNVIGNMNEFQVTIGETTFGGRSELRDKNGIMDYGSLIYVALQRSRTAKEAIKVMTDLVKEYGYYSSGESFSVADPNEAWILEMIGKGEGAKGAVWVAVRIPDDCIAAHANQARIHQFPLDDKENCIYSPDVISFARERGYFDGLNKDFSFANAYCPIDFGGLRACESRVWSFFNMFNKEAGAKYLPYIEAKTKEPMPLYIKPDNQISVRDIQWAMRDHYEGTALDITNDVGATPYKMPYRLSPLTFEVNGHSLVLNFFCNPGNKLESNPSLHLMGQVGYWICYGLFGTFGAAVVVLPLLVLNLSFFWKKYVDNRLAISKIVASLIFLVSLSALVHVFALTGLAPEMRDLSASELLYHGARMEGGGLIGGGVGFFLYTYMRWVGSIILLIALLAASLFFCLGMTPHHLWNLYRVRRAERRARKQSGLSSRRLSAGRRWCRCLPARRQSQTSSMH